VFCYSSLPKSPFAENALSFVSKAMAGQNIQTAGLSTPGNAAYQRMKQLMPHHNANSPAGVTGNCSFMRGEFPDASGRPNRSLVVRKTRTMRSDLSSLNDLADVHRRVWARQDVSRIVKTSKRETMCASGHVPKRQHMKLLN
jgi:hypothetical protein